MFQSDFYLKIDGIDGESKDAKMASQKAIDIDSWSWGQTNPADTHERTGLGAGRVTVQDMTFTSKVSKASPVLAQDCASGVHHKNGTLTLRKSGKTQQEYCIFKFYDVFVTSYHISGNDGGIPMETYSIAFSKYDVEYKTQNEQGGLTGSVKKGYDIRQNKSY